MPGSRFVWGESRRDCFVWVESGTTALSGECQAETDLSGECQAMTALSGGESGYNCFAWGSQATTILYGGGGEWGGPLCFLRLPVPLTGWALAALWTSSRTSLWTFRMADHFTKPSISNYEVTEYN